MDRDGLPWLTPDPGDPARRVGLSTANLLAPESDPTLAFQLMLGRVRYALAAKGRMRESLPQFEDDWSLLEEARARVLSTGQADTMTAYSPSGQRDSEIQTMAVGSPEASSTHRLEGLSTPSQAIPAIDASEK